MSLQTHGAILKRIGVTIALGLAFIVMASIFKPEPSTAGNRPQQRANINRARPSAVPARDPNAPNTAHDDGVDEYATLSTDAHAGLRSLGVIDSGPYLIAIFATDVGPRYTIVDANSRQELGTLLSVEQLHQLLPEIDLKGLDFSAPADEQPLMLAEPRDP